MKIITKTNRGKQIVGKKNFILHSFREKVLCFDNLPGYLFVSVDNGWHGVWIRKNNDPDFTLE
jgi:hypothetical protein